MSAVYRRKQSIVVATQWYPRYESRSIYNDIYDATATLVTDVGAFTIRPGDWIVEANGQKWIVERDLFDLLYEPLEEST